MEFRILGPLQVLDDGREVPLGSPKKRALLAILLLHPGDVISRDRLIDELWGESPPPTAAKALRVHVSQLRKALARNGHAPIATRTPGYAVHVDPEQVDAARFELLVAEARDHAAAGDVSTAREVFRDALALWRGPVLEGIDFELSTRNELARLEDTRLSAQMDKIDCDLALGLHKELIGKLEALAADHPLHERLRGQLMLALYRSGRQADALRVYRETGETLVRELGLQPSPSLQRLERAILNHDPALEAPAGIGGAAAKARDAIPTVRGRRPSRRALAGLIVVATVSAIVAVLVTRSHGGGSIAPSSIGVIDPKSNHITAQIDVPDEPGSIAVGDSLVWFTNAHQSDVTELDPRTRAVVRIVGVDVIESNIVVAAGSAWVIAPEPFDAVEKITPGSPTAQSIAIPKRRSPTANLRAKPPPLPPSCRDLLV